MKKIINLIIFVACFWLLDVATAVAEPSAAQSIVKIYTMQNHPDYYNPWSMHGPRPSNGSGAIISGNRILTNAHIVRNLTFVQVRRHGESKRHVARVVKISHDADLALLTVDDPSFFSGVTALELGTLPLTQDEVIVYGFPLGGDTLSTTKGVVSRIEHQTYAHSSLYLLAGQLDAAINPGNSGGPVLQNGKIAGVVMQARAVGENLGYMVPVTLVEHFLKDIADGSYDGYPALGIEWQTVENDDLRLMLQMKDTQSGVYINRVRPGSPSEGVLQIGDVILSIEGFDVEGDGSIEFREDERTMFAYVVQNKQIEESLSVEILRGGEARNVSVKLNQAAGGGLLVPMEEYDVLPTYYIYGGLVFTPLSKNFLKAWGKQWYNDAPKPLLTKLEYNFPKEAGDEVVVLLKVLASDVNQGYHDYAYWIVDEVNGQKVRNIRHLVEILENSTSEKFATFMDDRGQTIVLDAIRAKAKGAEILRTYQINADRSPDLRE